MSQRSTRAASETPATLSAEGADDRELEEQVLSKESFGERSGHIWSLVVRVKNGSGDQWLLEL